DRGAKAVRGFKARTDGFIEAGGGGRVEGKGGSVGARRDVGHQGLVGPVAEGGRKNTYAPVPWNLIRPGSRPTMRAALRKEYNHRFRLGETGHLIEGALSFPKSGTDVGISSRADAAQSGDHCTPGCAQGMERLRGLVKLNYPERGGVGNCIVGERNRRLDGML